MFLEHAIPARDPRLESIYRHFRTNLESILQSARNAGANILLCTVLSNERDFAPFLSRHRTDLAGFEQLLWQAQLEAGDAAFARQALEDARQAYEAAWEIDDRHADLAFRLGRLHLARQSADEARPFLTLARDLDALRFRTDSQLNASIRQLAADFPDEAMLVDLARKIPRDSPFGIAGDEWLYEHVHLNFAGTFAVADAVFASATEQLHRSGRLPGLRPQSLQLPELRRRLAFTLYEQALIIHQLLARFEAPPFTHQRDHAFRVGLWRERLQRAEQRLAQPGARDALIPLYEEALRQRPDDWILQRNFGMTLVAFDRAQDGLRWLEKAAATIDDDPDTLFALGSAYRPLGEDEPAEACFAALRRLEPRYPGLPPAGLP